MSRLDVAGMQKPEAGGSGKPIQYPDVDIGPTDWTPPQPEEQQPAQQQDAGMAPYLKGIQEQLTRSNDAVQNQTFQQANQLLQDPVIRNYVQQKMNGQQAQIGQQQQSDPIDQFMKQPDEDVNWTELAQDPAKFGQAITKQAVSGTAKAIIPLVQGMLTKHLAPVQQIGQAVAQLAGQMQNLQQERVHSEINTVRAQNPQLFDELRPVMEQLSGQFPAMNTADLFNFAMMKTGKTQQTSQQLQSERPNQQTSARPPVTNQRQQALGGNNGHNRLHPRQAFDQSLSNILNNNQALNNLG